jgi:hypothetical protein
MVLSVLLSALVWGPSSCPSPEQVDAHLSVEDRRQLIVELSVRPEGLQLEAQDLAGRPMGTRVLPLQKDCDAGAEAVAKEIRAWPARPPLRTPLHRLHATVAPAPVVEAPADAVEVVGEVGAVMAPGPRAFVGRLWLVRAPYRGALTVGGALDVTGPVLNAWQLSFAPAVGLRKPLGGVTLDAFIGVPMSVLTTTAPSFILSGLAGARVSVGELRLAPFVQLAVAVPLVKSVPLDLPIASLTLSVGLRGGVW